MTILSAVIILSTALVSLGMGALLGIWHVVDRARAAEAIEQGCRALRATLRQRIQAAIEADIASGQLKGLIFDGTRLVSLSEYDGPRLNSWGGRA